MATAITVIQMLVRLCFLVLLVLGVIFWTGHLLNLIPTHMLLGIALVLGLWTTAIIAAIARAPLGIVIAGLVWGAIVLALGMKQFVLLPGSTHSVAQVAHLLVGIAAIALNERLAVTAKQRITSRG
jgi:hypothetical protein